MEDAKKCPVKSPHGPESAVTLETAQDKNKLIYNCLNPSCIVNAILSEAGPQHRRGIGDTRSNPSSRSSSIKINAYADCPIMCLLQVYH